MRVLVLGAGMMARAVAYDLARADDVGEIRVADIDRKRLRGLKQWLGSPKLATFRADVTDHRTIAQLMRPCDVAVSCVPYFLNLRLTKVAIATRTGFCDLGGNNDVVKKQLAMNARAKTAGITVVPDCGLAPGMVSILVADGFSRLDRTDEIHIRVGGLPGNPKPPLNYRLVFSAHGLLNEYSEKCLVLRNGRLRRVEPLADVEEIRFPRPFGRLEAFNTSGGSSTLPYTFRGKVKTLDYKTIRYPGHCDQFKLLFDLGLCGQKSLDVDGCQVVPRSLLVRLLEQKLGFGKDDVVLLRVELKGTRNQKREAVRYQLVDYADKGTGLTAMMRMTGFPAAIVGLMLGRGQAKGKGVLPGERVLPTGIFIAELKKRGIKLRVT